MKIPFKRLRYALGGVFLTPLEVIIPRVPLPLIVPFLDLLFIIAYPITILIPSLKKTLYGNLDIAFGDTITKSEKNVIARRVLKNFFKMLPILIHYAHPRNHHKVEEDIDIVGREHLDRALKEGNGVIGLGAHIGSFVLLVIRLALSDIPFIVVTKEPRNEIIADKYRKWKELCNINYIDTYSYLGTRATRSILKGLRKNNLVYLIADERKKRDGILVPFFGKPALTVTGPAVLSMRTKSPILPIFITQRGKRRHVIDILPPLEIEKTGDIKRDIYAITEAANLVIENYIRRHPDQWGSWFNPRWKVQGPIEPEERPKGMA